MRNSSMEMEKEGTKRLTILITVRQLDIVVPISESLAKIALQAFVSNGNVSGFDKSPYIKTILPQLWGYRAGRERQ